MGDAPKKLIAKLAEACDAVGGVEKKGKNEKQGYKYLKAADVAKAIRHELFSRGVIVIIDEKEYTHNRTIKTNAGGEMSEFLLKAEVTFRDENEVLGPFGAFGVAMDLGDKAIWKAKTGILKYVLRQLGQIPDEKDDPEADESVDKAIGAESGAEFDQRTEGQRRIALFQIDAFWKATERTGKTKLQVEAYLKELGSYVQVEEITKDQFKKALEWANGPSTVKHDLTDKLNESVEAVELSKAMKRLFAVAKEKNIPEPDLKRYAYEAFAVDSLKSLTLAQLKTATEWASRV